MDTNLKSEAKTEETLTHFPVTSRWLVWLQKLFWLLTLQHDVNFTS